MITKGLHLMLHYLRNKCFLSRMLSTLFVSGLVKLYYSGLTYLYIDDGSSKCLDVYQDQEVLKWFAAIPDMLLLLLFFFAVVISPVRGVVDRRGKMYLNQGSRKSRRDARCLVFHHKNLWKDTRDSHCPSRQESTPGTWYYQPRAPSLKRLIKESKPNEQSSTQSATFSRFILGLAEETQRTHNEICLFFGIIFFTSVDWFFQQITCTFRFLRAIYTDLWDMTKEIRGIRSSKTNRVRGPLYRSPTLRYIFEKKIGMPEAAEGAWVNERVFFKAVRLERKLIAKYRRWLRQNSGEIDQAGPPASTGSPTSAFSCPSGTGSLAQLASSRRH